MTVQAGKTVAEFIAGVRAYRGAGRTPRRARGRVVWREGATCLRALGYSSTITPGKAILLVPSLINRAHILDLTDERSLCRWLTASGFHPFVLDWGAPGVDERAFGADAYILRRLEPALAQVAALGGGSAHIGGYCMGGLFATALAARNPGTCASLSLIATPWDFHAYDAAAIAMVKAARPIIEILTENGAPLGVDSIQTLFSLLDPFLTVAKFRRFNAMPKASAQRDTFIQLEDWLGDGVPLSAPLARQALFDWFGANTPGKGTWTIGGRAVRPERLTLPVFGAISGKDHIVPAPSAGALIAKIRGAHRLDVDAGHIGMVVGGRARKVFYEPWARWLGALG
ncbi:alpha/beta fold hydrolase [Varunaivibrio sulfuroxidans]|uniref:alpha/beta fold hydrolase n=1 Tax=Varunaivibrio sulfuroxidans TaxID=1773489 RepID=UPI00140500C5|nr:alpha/beta fold hydrolase [Varunaivibrio sulfuroxidans]WES32101.1 alpha/beta fold hydrolase [Varunaivibrio sulfuroxidans]